MSLLTQTGRTIQVLVEGIEIPDKVVARSLFGSEYISRLFEFHIDLNRGQQFVIGGYTLASGTFDALVFGYYEIDRLIYVARTRNGFTPASRVQLFKRFGGLATAECPFVNLPESKVGRWGQGLTAAKMAECRWLTPVLVGQFEFVEWTPDNHLRHSHFLGLRENKNARDVGRGK